MVSEGNSSSGSGEDDDSRPPRIVFLALIMLVSCVVNIFLLYAISRSSKVRCSVQSVIIVNIAALCLGDCFLNMSLVMGSLAAESSWGFDDTLCKWHAFVMNLVLIETVLLLTVLACDRFLAVKFLQKYDSLISPARLAFVIVFTWIQSLAFSIPFCFSTVKMTFRPKLHTCSVSDETPLSFICSASVLCFLAPTIIIVIMFIFIFRLNYKQQHEVKTIMTQNHYTDQLMDEPILWKEMLTVKYVGVLCILWFIMEIPYVITTYIQQYRYSSELSFSVDYPWGVDVAFVWMRFSFSAVFPCATFIWKKDLWQSCRDCVICHRSNSVLDIQVKVDPSSKRLSNKDLPPTVPPRSKDRDMSKPEPPSLLAFNVPVLFATSEGMYIQSQHSQVSDHDDTLKGRQLDIDDPNGLPEDTSDYDSVMEAEHFSSQVLSARHIRGALDTGSLPDLQTEQNERGASASIPDFADSGLELSGTAGSSRGKGIQRLMRVHQGDEKVAGDNRARASTHLTSEFHLPGTEDVAQIHSDSSAQNERKKGVASSNERDVCDVEADETSPSQNCAPSALPKVRGRLKPLNPGKKPKAAKSGQPKKKAATKQGSQRSDSARNAETKNKLSNNDPNGSGKVESTEQSKAQEAVNKSLREGKGKGHRRTKTSESEKALLSSNSSVEMQSLKKHSSDAASADKQTHY